MSRTPGMLLLLDLPRTGPLLLCLVLLAGCQSFLESGDASLSRFEYTHPQMGTQFGVVIYGHDEVKASKAAAAAFARIDQLNEILSDYLRTSELSQLGAASGNGQWIKVSDDLWNVLRISDDYSRQSDGAFDITIGPVVQLWRWARRNGQLPSRERLDAAVKTVGYDKIEFDTKTQSVRLMHANMRLDAGGIGKGYACDEAMKILKQQGFTRAMIDGGGGVVVGDPPPGRKGWRIGIGSLDPRNEPPSQYVILTSAAISTSGDAWQHIEIDGQRYSHIVDSKTGLGLTDHSSVSIVAPTGTLSDVLSTTVAVLGPQRGLAFVDKQKDAAAFIVRKPGNTIEVYESKRVKSLTIEAANDQHDNGEK